MLFFLSSHGNNCAGIIAGVANNSRCGMGLAYNAKIAGNFRLVYVNLFHINLRTYRGIFAQFVTMREK